MPHEKLWEDPVGNPTRKLREQVVAARSRQSRRQYCLNNELQVHSADCHCTLKPPAQSLLNRAMQQLGLSARAYHRIVRLARTVADLDESETIEVTHIGEAIQLRCLDRQI